MRIKWEFFEDDSIAGGGGFGPFVICDTCGEKIIGEGSGIVQFDRDQVDHARAVHLGDDCDRAGARLPSYEPLERFLAHVAVNAQIQL